jgi:uncharacterized protein (DUF362 family)
MAKVVFQDAGLGVDQAISKLFESFGGGKALLKPSGNVFIKVNGIDFKPHVYTSPKVVGEVVRYFFKEGAHRIFVIENSTQGNITRLVFEITGMKKMCSETGAIPVYLDETGQMPMYLPGLQGFVEIPDFVHDHLIRKRNDNLYISIPKLKSHSMTTVTLGIKNQFGLLHHKSRIADHNFKLHQKIADIYANIQPDFTIVDGLEATNHGHYPASSQKGRCVVPVNVIFGGDDPLAVDVIGARFLGFDLEQVEHLKLSARYGIGESRSDQIEIGNRHLFEERKQQFSFDLLDLFPEDVTIVRGKTRCCPEGCKRNTETVLEVFAQDFGGCGGFTILMGKGIDPGDVAHLDGPVHIAGDCAIQDWYPQLIMRLGKKNITTSTGCNNLAATIEGLAKWMKIPPLKLVPVNPLKSLKILLQAKLHGTKANIPPVIRF